MRAFVCVPLLSLMVAALAWLSWGLDLPATDDWRAYATGQALSLDLAYLFQAEKYALYPVGKILDVLAQRWLGGSCIAYQLLSMLFVLGSLLALQWRLLSLAVGDRLLAASAFALAVFMLQPGSYWGRPNLAYHQALPLVFLLAVLALVLGPGWSRRRHAPAVAALGLACGFSYVSGAVAAITAAAVLLAFAALVAREEREPLLSGGMALMAAGLLSTGGQLAAVLLGGKSPVRHGSAMSLPTESDFWFVLLGKIARAASLHELPVEASLIATLILVTATVGILGMLLVEVVRGGTRRLADARLAIVYTTLAAVIAVYLCMIAAARADNRAPSVDTPIEYFALGFRRLHFFWVTLLWPWVGAAILHVRRAGAPVSTNRARALALSLPLFLLPAAAAAGAFAHFPYFQRISLLRAERDVACLQRALQRGGTIDCERVTSLQMAEGFAFALSIDAAFTRNFPIPPVSLGSDAPPPLFRLSSAEDALWSLRGAKLIDRSVGGLRAEPAGTPEIAFRTGAAAELERCVIVEVGALIATDAVDAARLQYRTAAGAGYRTAARAHAVPGDTRGPGAKRIYFLVASREGFGDDFRIAPLAKRRPFAVQEVELRCRLESDKRLSDGEAAGEAD